MEINDRGCIGLTAAESIVFSGVILARLRNDEKEKPERVYGMAQRIKELQQVQSNEIVHWFGPIPARGSSNGVRSILQKAVRGDWPLDRETSNQARQLLNTVDGAWNWKNIN